MKEDDVVKFAKALVDVKRELTYCSICGHITEKIRVTFVKINKGIVQLFVWLKMIKMLLQWKMREYKGLYHVLHGSISNGWYRT